jgi:hypothetical protein
MTKQVIYKYLGTNGVIESPVHLEDIYYVRLIRMVAGEGKILTDGTAKHNAITVPEEEAENWIEVNA